VRTLEPTAAGVIVRLEVPDRTEHLPGQHYVLRLIAEDGYVAQRSYSVASAPSDPLVELYVERLEDGEVSTFLADVLVVGDELEVQGPIGGYFVWAGDRPALGLAGGSGVVPLVAMLRHAVDVGATQLLRLAVSTQTVERLPYAPELAGALLAVTRANHAGRRFGRLTVAELQPLVRPGQTVFVCGSARFAEGAQDLLHALGVDDAAMRFERFGPTG
jgi:ferredoxin-NADP reductase